MQRVSHRVMGRQTALHNAFSAALVCLIVLIASAIPQTPYAYAQAVELEPLTLETTSGRHTFMIEIVDNDESRGRGLMFRKELAADYGMLFDFRRMQDTYFWMKNTYVSLDMVFIREDGSIARIARDTQPLSETVIPSREPVRFVLEVVAGTTARIGLKAGDRIIHPRIGDP